MLLQVGKQIRGHRSPIREPVLSTDTALGGKRELGPAPLKELLGLQR